ncbi:InlB B-repeat-containing protein [Lysinibacillus sp. FSL H8-0500]|uniref:InlB B-repeat-containing protein n=1 Tax=Lysinibacillus sp. FSL H8-0500 TaxID=2921393 RepID=UPI00310195BD
MQRKTKQALALIAIVALFMQTLFGSLPAMATGNLSPLHITMTINGQPYNEGDTATSPVEVQVATTSGDSAGIEISQDARTTWQPFDDTQPLVITEEGEHELWFRLADVEEKRIIKIDSRLVQPLQLMKTTAANSVIIYVDAKSNGGNGESWTTAYNNLQQALDDAKAKLQVDPTKKLQIWLVAGTYKPTKEADGTGARYRTFQMQNNVAIYGGFNGTESHLEARDWVNNKTILSGDIGIVGDNTDNVYHVLYHPNGLNLNTTAILDGVTITGGNANGSFSHRSGGGMLNENGSSPQLTNVIFDNNTANSYGGGMFNNGSSSPQLTDVTFDSNNANSYGGGMCNWSSSPTLTDVTFDSNNANVYGGGMYNWSSSPTLTDVTFDSNTSSYGGGMYNNGSSSPTLINVTFDSNTSSYGGGMYNDGSSPTLTNVIFNSNTANSNGGGMLNSSSSPTLTNVIFDRNNANMYGGGMLNSSSSPTLTNVTMSGNKGTYVIYGGDANSKIQNSIIVGNNGEPALHSNVGGTIGNSLLDVEENGEVVAKFSGEIQGETYTPEAIFMDPNQQDYQLRIKSPAIDRGQNILNRTQTDLAGNPRIQGSAIDLGAYEANFYEVIYKENGATVGDVPIGKMTYQQGETVTVQANSGSLERTGYTFTGWNMQADGEGTSYTANDTFQVTANITLYAQWTANPTYTVTYNPNGATGGDIPEDTQRYEENTSVTVQGNSGNLIKTGYTFAGWNTQADGQGDSYAENGTFTMGTSNQILYAKWIPNTYKVTFESNGGSYVAEQQVLYNKKAIEPPMPSKQGHTFAGWYTDRDEKWDFAVDVVTKNITLYAQWKVISNPPPVSNDNGNNNGNDHSLPAKVKITLHTNGGTALAPIDMAYNTKISDLPVPTREGYRFDGWYQDEALTKPWVADTVLRENISLYAKWAALPVEEPQPQPELEAPSPTVTFSDIQRHWAQEMIEELATEGIIQGFEDGTFRPNESISRMHVAALLTRAFSFEQVREGHDFKDVSLTHPYYEAIMTLQQAGIVDGTNGAFLPNEKMTRAQLAKVLVGLMGRTPEGTSSFTDVDQKHWSAGYIAVLEQEGIALGDNGKFRPNDPVTRAQFVTFLYRVMQTIDS